MRRLLTTPARWLLRRLGWDLVRWSEYPADFEPDIIDIVRSVQAYTMTSPERIHALCTAVKYVVANDIPGDIVECGVWKGGGIMAAARTLLQLKADRPHLYLFDTFEGMPAPGSRDVAYTGEMAEALLTGRSKRDPIWAYCSLEEVRKAVATVGYDPAKIHFIKGRVEDTVPAQAPAAISLLRLDTDWYESTRHELIHLFPRVSLGGVILLDDYGHWKGARQAADEYVREHNVKLLLHRIDYTGRIGIKL